MTGNEGARSAEGAPTTEPAGMRLNKVPPIDGGRGGTPDLASVPSEKRAAANAIELHLEPDTKKAGSSAEDRTGTAVKEFNAKDGHGWATSRALKKAHTAWEDQVAALMRRLASDKAALRATATTLRSSDLATGSQIRRPSPLDQY
ncbi:MULTISPECIES: hypothetical protein [Streptomyces]|uniref:Uncharacterized protein n=1 Tax=Streptomyces lasiicapitis TaxID=1923961 RepID=A0ABQ2LHZ0_9ACTN|nr:MULTISPECIES: hypothetical protein [Streptomyces]QIB43837.1 hypothetical protein G3H79_12780 [Streptomyces aureoverticillatus]GGO34782.1 hypothetical protein GCM10012286_04410 [Streptomyces lasiicapitis]